MSGEWLKERSDYKPMTDLEGRFHMVHKGDVLGKLREGWDIGLQSASLKYLRGDGSVLTKRLQLKGFQRDVVSQRENLIMHLEGGWVFGVVKKKTK
jgi:hypothetical protein